MQPETKKARTMTAAEYLLAAPPGRSELIRGEVVPVSPAGFRHGKIVGRIYAALAAHVEKHGLGEVVTADSGFFLSRDPDTVRGPDVAFVERARIPSSGVPDGFFPGPPDLAVEVVSPSDRWEEVEEKVMAYLAAGTRDVWVASPGPRSVHVFRPGKLSSLHGIDDTLTTDLLPGFALPLADIFGD